MEDQVIMLEDICFNTNPSVPVNGIVYLEIASVVESCRHTRLKIC